jgi:hypothetical protein
MPSYFDEHVFVLEAIQSFSCLLYFACCHNVLLFQHLVVAHAWLFNGSGFTGVAISITIIEFRLLNL